MAAVVHGVTVFDVFMSYARADRERVLPLRDALVAQGLTLWIDERSIDTFASISASIEDGLAHCKALVAFYSRTYPTRRACQWELTAAFVAAQSGGGDPRRRVLVINPESGPDHIRPVQLRDALTAAAPAAGDDAAYDELARRIAAHVEQLEGPFSELRVSARPSWFGRRPVGAARFVGRATDMWRLHSALSAADVPSMTGARGDPVAQVIGLGGIGKSLLAQEYALRFAAVYPGGVFWLAAHGHDETSETLTAEARNDKRDAQLLAFADDLGIKITELPSERVPAAITRELDARGERFLWIVDDLPGGLDSANLETWLAPDRLGRTLLTTRSHDYVAIGTPMDLGVLDTDEGLELLDKHRRPEGREEEAAARGLTEDLGGHALALDVAGAALHAERGVRSYAAYRDALAEPSADELELAAGFVGELPGGHEASIATTLARSIKQLDATGLDFLRLASRLTVAPIPAYLVIEVFAVVDELDEDAARMRARCDARRHGTFAGQDNQWRASGPHPRLTDDPPA